MSVPPLAGSLCSALPSSSADAAGPLAAGLHAAADAPPAYATTNATLSQALLTLEQRLLAPEVRQNLSTVAVLLADEFREVGKSGRTYAKAQILALLEQEAPQTLHIEAFAARPLGPEAALATYDSVSATGARAHRSSVWIYRQGRWQMLHHQGTAAAAVAEVAEVADVDQIGAPVNPSAP